MDSNHAVETALGVLERGGLVALPTETVYGLAANAENELAVRRIFAVKGRPSTHPLIVHIAGAAAMASWAASIPTVAYRLAEAFWPGPLTLVLPRSTRASDAVTGGQGTVALRVPAHPLALELLRRFEGGGLAAPSGNRFGRVSPTCAEHVRADLGGDVDFVLDGGPCDVGVESTIVDVASGVPALLRPGGLAVEEIERVLGHSLARVPVSDVRAPGMLPSHYAPRAGLAVVAAGQVRAQAERLVGLGRQVAVLSADASEVPEGARHVAIPGDAVKLAQALYALLRSVDAMGVDVMVMALPEAQGLGLAVQDRLLRASAPRT